jgi:hypothetical protein
MVEMAGLKFQGKLHSGMDDVENMAKLLLRMVEDGCTGIGPNEEIALQNGPPFFRVFEGKSMDGEAHRFEKLLTGGANQNTFAAKAGTQQKPARKVALVTKSATPVVASSFAQRLKEIPAEIAVKPVEPKKPETEKPTVVSVEPTEETKVVEILDENKAKVEAEEKPEPQVEKQVVQAEKIEEKPQIKSFKRGQLLKIGVGFLASQDSEEYKRIALPIKNEIQLKLGKCQNCLSPTRHNELIKMSNGWCPKLAYRKPFTPYNKNNARKTESKQEKKKTYDTTRPPEKQPKKQNKFKNGGKKRSKSPPSTESDLENKPTAAVQS